MSGASGDGVSRKDAHRWPVLFGRHKVQFRQTVSLGMVAAGMFLAAPATAADAPAKEAEKPAVVARNDRPGLEQADALLKALTHRSVELQQRAASKAEAEKAASETSRTAAPARRAPLASRMSGPAVRRVKPPQPAPSDLAGYVALLSRTTPGGKVTGRFADWRSPSIYRVFGGMHNGYDVALPPGAAIVVGWPGRVTAITWWAGSEYGITVTSPDGFNTTYGHLAPAVREGAWVEPGDVVGFVCRDHVDIKMRDASGRFIDFARGVPYQVKLPPAVAENPEPSVPQPPPLKGPEWTTKPEAVRAAMAYLRLRHQEASLLASGGDAPAGALAVVRRQVAETRSRLLLHGVPEEVLLAAFVDSPALQSGNFSMGDAGSDPVAGVDLLGEWLLRQQMMRDARRAAGDLKTLLKDLPLE